MGGEGGTKMWLGRSGWDGDMVWEDRGTEMRSGRSEWDKDVVWMTCSDACSPAELAIFIQKLY